MLKNRQAAWLLYQALTTPIGNLEDITLRALRVLKSADVILSEDTRHSGKLLQHYLIKAPLLSYHKFNEFERQTSILKRLQEGDIVALISDAGTPCISDQGMELILERRNRWREWRWYSTVSKIFDKP